MTREPFRFLVIGAGPAGHTAATIAAALGAKVTVVEESVVGGAAHLWDCIPSKALVASSMRLAAIRHSRALGVVAGEGFDVDTTLLGERRDRITGSLVSSITTLLESQGVTIVRGRGRFTGPHEAVAETASGEQRLRFDAALVATGSRPWIPDWASVDGRRVYTTRGAYHLEQIPTHVVIIGAGVTGVEFTHIYSSLGSQVTLVVSRQQVLPHRDPEVAIVLEQEFLERGVRLLKGTRANAARPDGDGAVAETDDGRVVTGSHVLVAVGSVPNTEGLGLLEAGVAVEGGRPVVDEHQQTSVPHIYAAGDVTGQLPLSSVAAMQGRKIARHALGLPVQPIDLRKAAQAIFTEPEIASVGLEEADAAAEGRKVRITKVPFAANPRSLIQGTPRGFAKVISDPATHVVLGGTIVGHHASELIGVLAVAVQGGLRTDVLGETLLVHPSLMESLADAAD